MAHENEDRVVESLIFRHDAEMGVAILVDNGIRAFVWEDNYSYKVVVNHLEDLARASKLI